MANWFENYVNYAGSKTLGTALTLSYPFENYVNYAGSKTGASEISASSRFENYVNYAGSKTRLKVLYGCVCLRTM